MDERHVRALTAVLVAAAVITVGLAIYTFPFLRSITRDNPRSFDVRELDPIIAGTVIIVPPAESCGQGRAPVGDCDAGAEVRSRDGSPIVDVFVRNAESAGCTPVDPQRALFRAERGETLLVGSWDHTALRSRHRVPLVVLAEP